MSMLSQGEAKRRHPLAAVLGGIVAFSAVSLVLPAVAVAADLVGSDPGASGVPGSAEGVSLQVAVPAPTLTGDPPVDAISPAFLGMYRKIMEIEEEILRHSRRYGVDYDLARALCMYESGGNPDLTSWAGAKGFFQVMPSTFRSLGVDSNIEAGIKYLGQLVRQFGREDYALAAYNGGPGNVGRSRPMRLESLQYVIGIGHYRNALKQYEPAIRRHASELRLEAVGEGDDWWTLSERTGIPVLQLRLYNPYLAHRRLRAGYLIAHPAAPRTDLLEVGNGTLQYRARIGDNYFTIAFAFEVALDTLRERNGLWHLQSIPPGLVLEVPLAWEGEYVVHRAREGESLAQIAEALDSSPWRIIRDNGLFWQDITPGMLLRVRKVAQEPRYVVHRVSRGDTLIGLSRRYGATVDAIQRANNMGRRTTIQVGEQLRIPAVAE